MASVTKANIRRFVDEKNDCVTSSEFVNAAKATQYMTVMACRLPVSRVSTKTKWPGIQNFNNIQYTLVTSEDDRVSTKTSNEIKVTVQRAFGIGPGEVFRWSKLNALKNDIVSIDISVRHDNPKWQSENFEQGITI